jgi:hypothetical protein
MTPPLERRRFSRITIGLPVEFHTRPSDTAPPFQGQGVLRDISLGGTYFHVDPGTSLQQGQILSLTICTPLPYLEDNNISHLQATGEVVRFDPPASNRPQPGVALNFLEGPTFCATPAQQMF